MHGAGNMMRVDGKQRAGRWSRVAGPIAIMLLLASSCASAQQETVTGIPEQKIAALEKEFAALKTRRTSLVARRRDLKNIVRSAQELLEASPEAPKRFVLLELMFQSQKRLLAMDNTRRNRDTLFEICGKLAEAPDKYAEIRLEADLLLSEKHLAETNATLAERAQALEELIARYRGTAGEAKSLMMGAMIVQKLDAPALRRAILHAMDERFSGDPEVIQFRRDHLKTSRFDVTFKGEFKRLDGTLLRFPQDTMGHLSLMVFWSKDEPGIEKFLANIQEYPTNYPDTFDVFSFNVDELRDGGQSILRKQGLDWTVMRLPGGRKHQAYRTYAHGDAVALLVNAYGYAVLKPGSQSDARGWRGEAQGVFKINRARISEARYLAQLQSLFIGDFLVADPQGRLREGSYSLPRGVLRSVQDCFPLPPFRYRRSREEALENYSTAEALCSDTIEQHAEDSDIWILRNRKIIALLGQWSLAGDPGYLEEAVDAAKIALATELPPGADVVPRFCLAKDTLRRDGADPESVLAELIEETGGQDAPASALAAAAILALDAKSRELHETYRARFLAAHSDRPDFYSFTAFLRNRHHRYRLLRANYARRERGTRGYIVNHGREPMTEPMPSVKLKKPDGSTLTLPRKNTDKLTLLVFVEPPAEPGADFPVVMNRQGKPSRNDHVRRVLDDAEKLVEQHVNDGVELVAAFLCDNASRVEDLMKKNGWTCQAAMVPGGLTNPMVRQLGILSADRVPNVFLLRRDGSIAWRASGLQYQAEFGYPFAFLLAMKVHIEACEVERGYSALEAGDYEKAASIFAGPFRPARPDRYGWRSPRYHGQALAQVGLQEDEAALEAIEIAIDAHKLRHYRGRGAKRAADWRNTVADFTVKEPCDVLALLWALEADILEKLGREEEASQMRKKAEQPVKAEHPSVYKSFHERLKNWRINSKRETVQ